MPQFSTAAAKALASALPSSPPKTATLGPHDHPIPIPMPAFPAADSDPLLKKVTLRAIVACGVVGEGGLDLSLDAAVALGPEGARVAQRAESAAGNTGIGIGMGWSWGPRMAVFGEEDGEAEARALAAAVENCGMVGGREKQKDSERKARNDRNRVSSTTSIGAM